MATELEYLSVKDRLTQMKKKQQRIEKQEENIAIAQNIYFQTYGEKLVYDSIQQKGKYMIAVKKQGKEGFLRGAGGVKCERNSATYYFIDMSAKKSTKMIISSQGDQEVPFQHYSGLSETRVNIFSGKDIVADFYANEAYIDTSDIAQVSSFLSGRHPKAKYGSSSPEISDLFKKWHDRHGSEIDAKSAYDTKDIYKKYIKACGKELRKGLLMAKGLFDMYASANQNIGKFAQLRNRLADKIHIAKICSKPKQVLGGKAFGSLEDGR